MPVQNQRIMDFYQVAQQRDFTRQFQFRVSEIRVNGAPLLTQDDLVYVTTATLPARAINNVQVPYMGLQFNVPGAAQYPNSAGYNVTFRSDQQGNLRRVMEDWQRVTFDDQTSTGAYRMLANSRLTMDLLDSGFNTIRQYVLHGIYCQQVGEMTFNTTDAGTVVELPVTLAYQFWTRGITQ